MNFWTVAHPRLDGKSSMEIKMERSRIMLNKPSACAPKKLENWTSDRTLTEPEEVLRRQCGLKGRRQGENIKIMWEKI